MPSFSDHDERPVDAGLVVCWLVVVLLLGVAAWALVRAVGG